MAPNPYSIRLLIFSLLVWFIGSEYSLLHAQPTTSKEQAALVDGLLELLNEPPAEAKKTTEPVLDRAPAGMELDGEDIGEPSDNPLFAVRERMLTAAEYLSKGFANQPTQKLQSDIVARLDDLIEQLEQDNASQQSERQRAKAQSQQPTEPAQEPSPSSAATQPDSTGQSAPNPPADSDSPPSRQSEQSPSSRAQNGDGASPTVNLADPKALQQDVWGQLPEQVRKQMQSRMVERFLPSYRDQIEAYFQALIESAPGSAEE